MQRNTNTNGAVANDTVRNNYTSFRVNKTALQMI